MIFCPIDNILIAVQLQKDLLALKEWFKKWLLRFNVTKTAVMHLGNTKQKYTYYMDEQPLQVVSEHKDLSIIIDSNLKFHSQATAVTNEVNRILGLIKKSFNSLNIRSLPILYKSLARPHLEYAKYNVAWEPSYIGDVLMIEKVQRKATKCIPKLVDLENDDRQMALNLPSIHFHIKDIVLTC